MHDDRSATTADAVMLPAEFRQKYRISRFTQDAEIRAGRLRVHRVGRRILISRDDAERWFASRVAERVPA